MRWVSPFQRPATTPVNTRKCPRTRQYDRQYDRQSGNNRAVSTATESSFLTLVAGRAAAVRPTAGSIVFDGRRTDRLPPYRLARPGLIRTFHIAGVFDRLTVLENLLVGQPMRGESLRCALLGRRHWSSEQARAVDRGRELVARFEIEDKENEYAGNLSGGQKRLLEIARALMAGPRLLLLDEPTAGVAPALVRRIEDYLRVLAAEFEKFMPRGMSARMPPD